MACRAQKYTKVISLKITPVQDTTLRKLRSYNVPVAAFIRQAIKEKIEKDYKELLPKPKKEYCPF